MAGQDIRKLVPAGGGFPIQVSGDYIYLKFADRAIDVIINGGRSGQTRVNMEAGDKYRPGPFEAFEVVNPDPDNAAQVIFTVGEGDYNRQIVQGEITSLPVVRRADGSFADDSRGTVSIVAFMKETGIVRTLGAPERVRSTPETLRFGAFTNTGKYSIAAFGSTKTIYELFVDNEGVLQVAYLGKILQDATHEGDNYPISALISDGQNLFGIGAKSVGSSEPGGVAVFRLGPQKDGNDEFEKTYVGQITKSGQPMTDQRAGSSFNNAQFDQETGNIILTTSSAIYKARALPNIDISAEVATNYQKAVAINGEFWTSRDGVAYKTVYRRSQEDLSLIGTFETTTHNYLYGRLGDYVIAVEPSNNNINELALLPRRAETGGRQAVIGAGWDNDCLICGLNLYKALSLDEWNIPISGLTVDGNTVSGEIIRWMLQQKLKTVPADYLDYVHAIRFRNPRKNIESGGVSFARAEIEDNFTIENGERVELELHTDIYKEGGLK